MKKEVLRSHPLMILRGLSNLANPSCSFYARRPSGGIWGQSRESSFLERVSQQRALFLPTPIPSIKIY